MASSATAAASASASASAAAAQSSATAAAVSAAQPLAFDKPGQKHTTPSPGSGTRVFYQSLWEEKGVASPMALIWVIEHGVLSVEDAKKHLAAYEKAKLVEKKR